MSDQMRIPCVIMRAGTSKGIFIKENDLPKDQALRDKTILAIFGSPDVRQIDGLAGADPLTSKLAIIGPSTRDDADVDYTFGQVSIDGTVIDYSGNCGNISSGVGPFAIDESMVRAVEVRDGKAVVSGNCKIDGVPGTSAPILMDFASTAGAATGKLLPTGNVVDVIETSKGAIEASMVDVANPCIFVRASDVGMKGTETPSEINGNKALLELLEELRAKGAVMMGKCKTEEEARTKSPAFPMICFVTAPADYTDFTTGNTIKADEVDFVAAKIPGTIVNQVIPDIEHKTRIRIGHPAGVLPVVADVKDGHVEKAAFERTARRIMEGYVYVETSKIYGKQP